MSLEERSGSGIPTDNGVVCIRPEPACWASLWRENKQAAAGDSARDLDCRTELLSRARDYTQRLLDTDCPHPGSTGIIGTGHQAIWHHCGIWVKTLVASRFAEAVDATGLHIVVDHDVCDTALAMPRQMPTERWTRQRVEIEAGQRHTPLELREPPPRRQVEEFLKAVTDANRAAICTRAWRQTDFLERGRVRRLRNVSDLITYLHATLNVYLGIPGTLYLPVSELSRSDAFIRFAVSVMADALAFSCTYNQAVEAHNPAQGRARRATRPLVVDKERCSAEVPFWLTGRDGRRQRLMVEHKGRRTIGIKVAGRGLGDLDSASPDARVDQLRGLLEQHGYLLRPKAVALTLFVRMALADWFVHGVGGARYESITDYLLTHYYAKRPPHFALATCTMTLAGDRTASQSAEKVSDLQHGLRAIECHPERHIPTSVLQSEPVASLVREKWKVVNEANDRRLPPARRKSAWTAVGAANKALLPYAGPAVDRLRQRLLGAEYRRRSERVRRCRDYFFGLFPESQLRALAGSVDFSPSGPGDCQPDPVSMERAPNDTCSREEA